MRDALNNKLTLGQRVAIPCNSRFKIGIFYGYKENRTKWYLKMKEYVENAERGIYPADHGNRNNGTDWRDGYWTRERVDEQANKYYIRFGDGKKRTLTNRESIIGIDDEGKIKLL